MKNRPPALLQSARGRLRPRHQLRRAGDGFSIIRWVNINFLWYSSWYASTPSPIAPNQSQNNSWSKEQILMAVGITGSNKPLKEKENEIVSP